MASKKLTVATPEDIAGATLMRLRVSGIKKIRYVDVSLHDVITTIGGDNAQGKSSFFDAYALCIGGRTAMKFNNPVHNGRQEGFVISDFGDGEKVRLSVKRTIKRVGETDFTDSVELDIPGHLSPTRVETFLKELCGRISFDPMMLDKMDDEARYEAVKSLIPAFDFKANAAASAAAYQKRQDTNRDLKRERAAADSIDIADKAPAEHIDEAELATKMEEAAGRNLDIQERSANRALALEQIGKRRAEAKELLDGLAPAIATERSNHERYLSGQEERLKALRTQIAAIEAEVEDAKKNLDPHLEAIRVATDKAAAEKTSAADELQARLDAAGELPAIIDVRALTTKLLEAQQSNRLLADWEGQRARRVAHDREAERLAAESTELSEEITRLDSERARAIEGAKLPIEGLGFGDGIVTLGGVHWSQASTMERIDASTALAMAMNPKLRVILIRNWNDLGSAARERIRKRAQERGYRVIAEVVDDSGSTSITMENGEVKGAAEPAAAEQAS